MVILGGVAGAVVRSARVGARIMYIDAFSPLPSSSLTQRLVLLIRNAVLSHCPHPWIPSVAPSIARVLSSIVLCRPSSSVIRRPLSSVVLCRPSSSVVHRPLSSVILCRPSSSIVRRPLSSVVLCRPSSSVVHRPASPPSCPLGCSLRPAVAP